MTLQTEHIILLIVVGFFCFVLGAWIATDINEQGKDKDKT